MQRPHNENNIELRMLTMWRYVNTFFGCYALSQSETRSHDFSYNCIFPQKTSAHALVQNIFDTVWFGVFRGHDLGALMAT